MEISTRLRSHQTGDHLTARNMKTDTISKWQGIAQTAFATLVYFIASLGWHTVVLAAPFTPTVEDFEDSQAAFRWSATNGVWQVGVPSVVGPSNVHSGTKCLATVINGNYPNGAASRAVSAPFDVPSFAQNPRLRFWQWFSIENGYDNGKVQISTDGGTTWKDLSSNITGDCGGVWTRSGYDLTQYAGQTVMLGFYFTSDGTNSAPGWYIDDITIATGPSVIPAIDDFEDRLNAVDRWVADDGLWEIGVPSSGPGGAHSGNNCMATVLGGNYPNSAHSRMISPSFIVPAAGLNPSISFWHWFSTENGYDYGQVQITKDNGVTWNNLGSHVTGDSGGWTLASDSLIAYAGQTVRIGFYFASEGTNVGPGWYIDEVQVLPSLTPPGIDVQQPAGTSLGNGSSSVEFGQVLGGTVASKTFVINNTGTSNLTLGTITIDGVNSADFTILTNPTSPLASGTSTSFTVNFAPGALYGRSATLHIPSSDPNQPVFNIALAGTGSLPAFTVQATSTVVHLGDANATVTVQRNFSQAASVAYATVSDTAVVGLDFTSTTGTLSFASGQLTKDITVPLLYRINAPNPAYFTVQLSNPSLIAGSPVPTVIGIPGSEGIYILNDHPTDLSLSQISTTPFPIIQPQTAPGATASLSVTLSPALAGGQWRLFGELAWRNSGTVAQGLTAGNYGVEFKPVNGYVAPAVQIVPVPAGTPATTSATYTASGTPVVGSLQVTLTPSNLGLGGWRLQGETTYRSSGATAQNLVTGSYIVEFAAVSGRVTPAARVVTIAPGTSTVISAVYLIDFAPQGATPQLVSVENRTTAPYCFVGEIQTDIGFGTGFVPLDRIVVTAAHVLFDDATLTYSQGVRWFFQSEVNAFEAPPQIPRGTYVMAGYSAQRAADHSPDVSTGASRQLDAAVMYFLEPTARGGQSGYLASNLSTNTWLKSPRDKFIAGYPVEGAGITPGLLYATPTVTNAFTFITGSLFSTTAMGSYPGNSGGPIFVRADDNSFYPAAIYLGGTNETVARAIDSQIIDLMNRGQVSGNGGANNTGGGITLTQTGLGTTASYGSIRVNTAPAGALASCRWTISGDSVPRTSGSVRTGLAPGNYTVSFNAVAGYTAPTPATVPVAAATETLVTATYAPLVPQYTVTPGAGLGGGITPSAAQVLNSGGGVTFTAIPDPATAVYPNIGTTLVDQWYLDGTSVQVGGATYTLTNVTANHTVLATFKQFTVTPSAGLHGNIIPNSPQPDGSIWFIGNPDAGYAVDQWLVNNAQVQTGGTTYLLSGVTANTTVQVAFKAVTTAGPYSIAVTASPPAGGSTSGGGTFNAGSNVTVAASPNPGYTFVNWSEGGTSVNSLSSYPFTATADRTLVANFILNSANANLISLVPSTGRLSPAFDSSTTSYTDSVVKTALNFRLTPTVAQTGATVTVNGTAVVSGSVSGVVPLSVGSNPPISIIVTAPDGVTKKTYTVTVTRSNRNSAMDINNDAMDDLLLQNNVGQIMGWYMDGTGSRTSWSYISTGPLGDWRVVGKGDFNNDGNTDILCQNNIGQIIVWYMNGAAVRTSWAYISSGALGDWRVVGTGDFNNDGNTDILCQNGIGQITAWYLNGAGVRTSWAYISSGALGDWRVVGTGDFDNDGNTDILCQNSVGQIDVWYMDGAGVRSSWAWISTGPLGDWRVVGTGDFNNDGNTDILCQNNAGQINVWYMNGAGVRTSWAYISTGPLGDWRVR